jgi:cytochrome P450
MPLLQLTSQLDLHTRCENQIENQIDRRPIRAGDQILVEDHKRNFPNAVHRPVGPSRKYNCHGLTFASRRTWIWKPAEVAKILADDEYVRVELADVLPGDIVLYVQNGDIEHSGIVMSLGPVPMILSKWGPAHEVVHRAIRPTGGFVFQAND